MKLDDFKKVWKKILIDKGITSAAFWGGRGVGPVVGARKINEGRIRFIEFSDCVESLGYEIKIVKKRK